MCTLCLLARRKTQSTKQSILIAFVENMAKRQIKKYSLGQKLKPDKLSGKRYPTQYLKTDPLSPTSH